MKPKNERRTSEKPVSVPGRNFDEALALLTRKKAKKKAKKKC